jgi:hypothetical protein
VLGFEPTTGEKREESNFGAVTLVASSEPTSGVFPKSDDDESVDVHRR